MNIQAFWRLLSFTLWIAVLLIVGCGNQPSERENISVLSPGNGNDSTTNSKANANADNSSTSSSTSAIDAKEPTDYQAVINLKLEAVGVQQKTSMPTLSAKVARSGQDRRMEFTMPAGGRIVFLDLNGKNYLVMPEKKQYAELDSDSLGFETRRLLMPEQIVRQVRSIPGVRRADEEKYNGRDVVRYTYGAVSNTRTQAGQFDTRSYLLVDKATGLPLRAEIESTSQSGANVQGYNGILVITEMSDITLDAPPSLFDLPGDFQKIDSKQVRSQVDLIFNSLTAVITQLINQTKQAAAPTTP
ncbi:MAG: hypothetical protein ABJA02_08570 [Acidobacteriota bacterium]